MKGKELELAGQGAFAASLFRNNKEIRADRAQSIVEDAELIFKRKIEDLRVAIKKMEREQDNLLDLSPTDAKSLVLASNFSAETFANTYIKLGRDIRDAKITLEIAEGGYEYLFGKKV